MCECVCVHVVKCDVCVCVSPCSLTGLLLFLGEYDATTAAFFWFHTPHFVRVFVLYKFYRIFYRVEYVGTRRLPCCCRFGCGAERR